MKLVISSIIIVLLALNLALLGLRFAPQIFYTLEDGNTYFYRVDAQSNVITLNITSNIMFVANSNAVMSFDIANYSPAQLSELLKSFEVSNSSNALEEFILKNSECKYLDIIVSVFNSNFNKVKDIRCLQI